jgi:hypothetical protein
MALTMPMIRTGNANSLGTLTRSSAVPHRVMPAANDGMLLSGSVAEAVTAAVEDFCVRKGQTVANRPAANPAGFIVTAPSQRVRPASFSR